MPPKPLVRPTATTRTMQSQLTTTTMQTLTTVLRHLLRRGRCKLRRRGRCKLKPLVRPTETTRTIQLRVRNVRRRNINRWQGRCKLRRECWGTYAMAKSDSSGSSVAQQGGDGQQDHVDKVLALAVKSTGLPQDKQANEKIPDQGREMCEQQTGSQVNSTVCCQRREHIYGTVLRLTVLSRMSDQVVLMKLPIIRLEIYHRGRCELRRRRRCHSNHYPGPRQTGDANFYDSTEAPTTTRTIQTQAIGQT